MHMFGYEITPYVPKNFLRLKLYEEGVEEHLILHQAYTQIMSTHQ